MMRRIRLLLSRSNDTLNNVRPEVSLAVMGSLPLYRYLQHLFWS